MPVPPAGSGLWPAIRVGTCWRPAARFAGSVVMVSAGERHPGSRSGPHIWAYGLLSKMVVPAAAVHVIVPPWKVCVQLVLLRMQFCVLVG